MVAQQHLVQGPVSVVIAAGGGPAYRVGSDQQGLGCLRWRAGIGGAVGLAGAGGQQPRAQGQGK